jgi:hypothetical protein
MKTANPKISGRIKLPPDVIRVAAMNSARNAVFAAGAQAPSDLSSFALDDVAESLCQGVRQRR